MAKAALKQLDTGRHRDTQTLQHSPPQRAPCWGPQPNSISRRAKEGPQRWASPGKGPLSPLQRALFSPESPHLRLVHKQHAAFIEAKPKEIWKNITFGFLPSPRGVQPGNTFSCRWNLHPALVPETCHGDHRRATRLLNGEVFMVPAARPGPCAALLVSGHQVTNTHPARAVCQRLAAPWENTHRLLRNYIFKHVWEVFSLSEALGIQEALG